MLATTTPDRPCPATAPDVAHRIGLERAAAFDVNAVCTGFLYGLASGAGLIASGVAERVLVIGADTFSTIIDPESRTTGAIFGDGAGAVVLRAGAPHELGALGPFDLGSDGQDADLIMVPAGGSRQRSTGEPAEPGAEYFTMAGKAVFRKAIFQMAGVGADRAAQGRAAAAGHRQVRDPPGERADHQRGRRHARPAGRASSSATSTRSATPRPRRFRSRWRRPRESGELRAGQRVLLGAFGGGLTWGSTVLRWPDIEAM